MDTEGRPVAYLSRISKDKERIDKSDCQRAPKWRADEAQPGQKDIGATQQRNEKPVTPCRIQPQKSMPGITTGPTDFQYCHRNQARNNETEERGRWPGPCHPGQTHKRAPFLNPTEGEALGDVVANEVDHESARNDGQRSRGCQQPKLVS